MRVGVCERVCPRNCYEIDRERHIVEMPMRLRCVKCDACIVRCPKDALYFRDPYKNIMIPPETIRK